ncbi:hypothetical protein ACFL0E_00495 [Nanoarchaeota archaeon]
MFNQKKGQVTFILTLVIGIFILAGSALIIPDYSITSGSVTEMAEDSSVANVVVDSSEKLGSDSINSITGENQISTMVISEITWVTSISPFEIFVLSLIAVIVIFSIIFVYFEFVYPPVRLKRKLSKIEMLIEEEPIELLKSKYDGIYNLYLKLSEIKKKKYYPSIIWLREKIESYIQAEKEIEELFEKASRLRGFKQQKQMYVNINALYNKLPPKNQEKYYQRILHLREKLERKN